MRTAPLSLQCSAELIDVSFQVVVSSRVSVACSELLVAAWVADEKPAVCSVYMSSKISLRDECFCAKATGHWNVRIALGLETLGDA